MGKLNKERVDHLSKFGGAGRGSDGSRALQDLCSMMLLLKALISCSVLSAATVETLVDGSLSLALSGIFVHL